MSNGTNLVYPEIRIVLPDRRIASVPYWRQYGLVPISPEHRSFMPGYKIPFDIDTDIGTFETEMTSDNDGIAIGDPLAGKFFSRRMKRWYRHHPELEPYDTLIITRFDLRHYRLNTD